MLLDIQLEAVCEYTFIGFESCHCHIAFAPNPHVAAENGRSGDD